MKLAVKIYVTVPYVYQKFSKKSAKPMVMVEMALKEKGEILFKNVLTRCSIVAGSDSG